MTTKSFERPLMTIAESLVYKKAQLIDSEYKLDIKDLEASEKLELVSKFMEINSNLDQYLQEFINDACMDRMWAESSPFGGWDE